MPDDVKLPGGAHVDKKIAIGVGAAAVLIAGVYYYRQKQASASSTTAATASGSQIDPQTGYAYGSPEDQAALTAMSGGTLPTYDAASSVGGQVIGYDQFGQPVYGGGGGTGGPNSGPGSYTSNAQWTQAAEAMMGSTGADSIAAALGKYLLGQPLSTDQVTVVQEAIASQGYPPVSGSGGFPPSYNTAAVPPPVQSGPQVAVPNVVGEYADAGRIKLTRAGFIVNEPVTPHGKRAKVVATAPTAGTKAAKGSTVNVSTRIV